MPPFVLGIFDQFVSARLLDRYPQLYQLSQKGVFFRTHNFWSWIGNGFYHSLLLYFLSELIYWDDSPMRDGKTSGHWVWGTSLFTSGLVTVLGKAALITNIWTKYTVIAIPGSLAVWFIFLPVYATVAPKLGFSTEYTNLLPVLMSDPKTWLMMVVLPAVCLVRDLGWKYAKRMFWPESYHHVQEIQKYNIQDYRPRYVFLPGGTSELGSRSWYGMITDYCVIGWNNSKRLYGRSGRCRGCGSSAGTRFRKLMRVRRGFCRLMILLRREGGMGRCRLVGGGEVGGRWMMEWNFLSERVFSGFCFELRYDKCICMSCMWDAYVWVVGWHLRGLVRGKRWKSRVFVFGGCSV